MPSHPLFQGPAALALPASPDAQSRRGRPRVLVEQGPQPRLPAAVCSSACCSRAGGRGAGGGVGDSRTFGGSASLAGRDILRRAPGTRSWVLLWTLEKVLWPPTQRALTSDRCPVPPPCTFLYGPGSCRSELSGCLSLSGTPTTALLPPPRTQTCALSCRPCAHRQDPASPTGAWR